MKQCPFDVLGSMGSMTSIPHIEKGQGDDSTFNDIGGALMLSTYV